MNVEQQNKKYCLF